MMLEEKATELLTKFESIADQVGPQAVEATLSAVQYASVGGLVTGVVLTAAAAILANFSFKFYKEECKQGPHSEGGYGFASLASAVVGAFLGMGGLANLFNVWHWVGIFDPAAVLAAKIVL